MQAYIMCGGRGTRIINLTRGMPKSLLEITGKTIVERILEKLPEYEKTIVTNEANKELFQEIAKKYKAKIIEDKTNRDIIASISNLLAQDCIIVLGDNIFDFDIKPALEIFKKTGKFTLVAVPADGKPMEHFGALNLDGTRVKNFEEKPLSHKYDYISTGIYFFAKKNCQQLQEYAESEDFVTSFGKFVEWLVKREEIRAYVAKGEWYDVGIETEYKQALKVF